MTGPELLARAALAGVITHSVPADPATHWAQAPEATRAVYEVIARQPGGLSGEELYDRILASGVWESRYPFRLRSPWFQRDLTTLASLL